MAHVADKPVVKSGTWNLGDLTVHRLGYGAMRLTGRDAWGPPPDKDEAIRAVRHAIDLGVDFIDTADSYGPFISELLLKEALYPYPANLVIATKAGHTRPSPAEWVPVGRPEYIRQQCELSLRNLAVERIDLFQIHRLDPHIPIADQIGTLRQLQKEGKVRAVGLSNATLEDIEQAAALITLVSIQLRYSVANRKNENVLKYCENKGLAFIPWAPMNAGDLAVVEGPLKAIATQVGGSPAQVALAWLLQRSPVVLPIPGSASVLHVEENCNAAGIRLSEDQMARIDQFAPPPAS
jgi:aryl-alcohol dehydrogenase-like predicted oxidoreductase